MWAPGPHTRVLIIRGITPPPTHSDMGTAAAGAADVARAIEVPQPPPNKHSVDGDGSVVAPAHKTPQPPPNPVSGDGNTKKKKSKPGRNQAGTKRKAR